MALIKDVYKGLTDSLDVNLLRSLSESCFVDMYQGYCKC